MSRRSLSPAALALAVVLTTPALAAAAPQHQANDTVRDAVALLAHHAWALAPDADERLGARHARLATSIRTELARTQLFANGQPTSTAALGEPVQPVTVTLEARRAYGEALVETYRALRRVDRSPSEALRHAAQAVTLLEGLVSANEAEVARIASELAEEARDLDNRVLRSADRTQSRRANR